LTCEPPHCGFLPVHHAKGLISIARPFATLHTPEGSPPPPNISAELQRDAARLGFLVSQIREIEESRVNRYRSDARPGGSGYSVAPPGDVGDALRADTLAMHFTSSNSTAVPDTERFQLPATSQCDLAANHHDARIPVMGVVGIHHPRLESAVEHLVTLSPQIGFEFALIHGKSSCLELRTKSPDRPAASTRFARGTGGSNPFRPPWVRRTGVTDELRAALLQVGDQRDIAAQPRRLAITSVAPVTLAQWRAAPSFGRSASLPLSTSTNSATSFPVPAVQEVLDSL